MMSRNNIYPWEMEKEDGSFTQWGDCCSFRPGTITSIKVTCSSLPNNIGVHLKMKMTNNCASINGALNKLLS